MTLLARPLIGAVYEADLQPQRRSGVGRLFLGTAPIPEWSKFFTIPTLYRYACAGPTN